MLAPDQKDLMVVRLLACRAMSEETKRDAIVGRLDKSIAIHITRHDSAKMDVDSIVTECADRPEGIYQLLAAVYHVGGHTYAWNELERYAVETGSLYHEEGVNFSNDEVRELERAILAIGFDHSKLIELRKSVAPRSELVESTLPLLLAELCLEMDQEPGVVPLVDFAEKIAAAAAGMGKGPALGLSDWIIAVRNKYGLRVTVPTVRANAGGNHAYLMVCVLPLEHRSTGTAAEYEIKAWRMGRVPEDAEPLIPYASPCSQGELREILEDLIDQAHEQDEVHDLTIEMVLPMHLLGEPIDTWYTDEPDRPFGQRHRLVVRSFERIYLPLNRKQEPGAIRRRPRSRWRTSQKAWKQRWSLVRARMTAPWEHSLTWYHGPIRPDTKLYNELVDRDEPSVAMTIVPSLEDLQGVIDAGMPVAVWPRQQFELNEIEAAVAAARTAQLETLPTEFRRLRNVCIPDELRGHLTLLWDDAERIPPDAPGADARLELPEAP